MVIRKRFDTSCRVTSTGAIAAIASVLGLSAAHAACQPSGSRADIGVTMQMSLEFGTVTAPSMSSGFISIDPNGGTSRDAGIDTISSIGDLSSPAEVRATGSPMCNFRVTFLNGSSVRNLTTDLPSNEGTFDASGVATFMVGGDYAVNVGSRASINERFDVVVSYR